MEKNVCAVYTFVFKYFIYGEKHVQGGNLIVKLFSAKRKWNNCLHRSICFSQGIILVSEKNKKIVLGRTHLTKIISPHAANLRDSVKQCKQSSFFCVTLNRPTAVNFKNNFHPF